MACRRDGRCCTSPASASTIASVRSLERDGAAGSRAVVRPYLRRSSPTRMRPPISCSRAPAPRRSASSRRSENRRFSCPIRSPPRTIRRSTPQRVADAGAAVVIADRDLDARRLRAAAGGNDALPQRLAQLAGGRAAAPTRRSGCDHSRPGRIAGTARKRAVQVTSYHFVGIGGIGMSAIARILLARGERVSGSDVKAHAVDRAACAREGARVTIGHDAENVARRADRRRELGDRPGQSRIRRGAARAALPVLHRGEMLARLIDGRRGIAICGTHGKTTTTAMIARGVARWAGIDASLVLGGIDGLLETNAHDGHGAVVRHRSRRVRRFVRAARAGDGGRHQHRKRSSHQRRRTARSSCARSASFSRKLPDDGRRGHRRRQRAVGVADRARVARAATVTFGLDRTADLRAANMRFDGLGTRFDAIARRRMLGYGRAARSRGDQRAERAGGDRGRARTRNSVRAHRRRRCDAFAACGAASTSWRAAERMMVVDDYAHHPTAVRATIAAARQYHRGPMVVAFQPHRYTRTAFLARDFADALRGADRVYLAPVYAASGAGDPGRERTLDRRTAGGAGGARCIRRARRRARRSRAVDEAPPGALVLMLGAGNITDVAARLAERVRAGAERRSMSLTTAQALRTLLTDRDREALREIFGERVQFDEPLAPLHVVEDRRSGRRAGRWRRARRRLAALMRLCFKRKLPWFVYRRRQQRAGRRRRDARHRDPPGRRVCRRRGADRRRGRRRRRGRLGRAWRRSPPRPRRPAPRASDRWPGFPGTVGGSLRMNAGTDREIGEFVREVWVQSPAKPEPHPVTVRYFYRHIDARARCDRRARDAGLRARRCRRRCARRCSDRLVRRKNTQPIALPNAGSCFRNPDGRQGRPPDRSGRGQGMARRRRGSLAAARELHQQRRRRQRQRRRRRCSRACVAPSATVSGSIYNSKSTWSGSSSMHET